MSSDGVYRTRWKVTAARLTPRCTSPKTWARGEGRRRDCVAVILRPRCSHPHRDGDRVRCLLSLWYSRKTRARFALHWQDTVTSRITSGFRAGERGAAGSPSFDPLRLLVDGIDSPVHLPPVWTTVQHTLQKPTTHLVFPAATSRVSLASADQGRPTSSIGSCCRKRI